MGHDNRMKRLAGIVLLALAAAAACDLDLQNPNAPPKEEVLSTPDGLVALAVGMQDLYASAVEDFVVVDALVTDEWGTGTRSLISYRSLLNGQSFDPSFLVVEAPWAAAYRTIKAANSLIEQAPQVGFEAPLQTGIVALAKLFKAMALGTIMLQYERVPIDVSTAAPVPQSRPEVLSTVLALLESARTDLAAVTDAELGTFRTRVQGTGFNFRNTVDAMLARYYLIAGQYQNAIDAANRVNPAVLSVFSYISPDANPIYSLSVGLQYVYPLRSFVSSAEAGDRRPSYWADTTIASFRGNPPDTMLYLLNKYRDPTDPYPVYLPDEMKLIKAEAHTRLAQYATAAALVNEVRIQKSSLVDEPVADLPALDPATQLDTEAELLAEIAKQRRYELYMQGLRWEDTRRLGTAITTTPTFTWLPIPTQECRTNPNAGC